MYGQSLPAVQRTFGPAGRARLSRALSRAKPREKPRDQQAVPERYVGIQSWVDRSLAVAALMIFTQTLKSCPDETGVALYLYTKRPRKICSIAGSNSGMVVSLRPYTNTKAQTTPTTKTAAVATISFPARMKS